jgi:cysteine synthase A
MIETNKYHILGAFVLGATVASVWSAYRVRHDALHGGSSQPKSSENDVKQTQEEVSRIPQPGLNQEKRTTGELELSVVKSAANIKEGIEGCIGNTPLIKIKSLSDATGCEILAKAEVTRHSTVLTGSFLTGSSSSMVRATAPRTGWRSISSKW